MRVFFGDGSPARVPIADSSSLTLSHKLHALYGVRFDEVREGGRAIALLRYIMNASGRESDLKRFNEMPNLSS